MHEREIEQHRCAQNLSKLRCMTACHTSTAHTLLVQKPSLAHSACCCLPVLLPPSYRLCLSLPQVTTIPFDLLVLQMAGLQRSGSITAW